MDTLDVYLLVTEKLILYLLFFTSIFCLRFQYMYLTIFIIGYIVNLFINFFLKGIFKQPRAAQDKKFLERATANGYRSNADQYGMPSDHSQTGGFCLTYLALATRSSTIMYIYAIVVAFIMGQRYFSKSHTGLQIIVGFTIGCLVGYLFYCYAASQIKGPMKHKKDDNAVYYSGI
jgi:membrane-associated phospholipid phosphatase